MAPPKRKTGGRVTAAGTRPTDKRKTTGSAATADREDGALGLFVVGALLIMARYLFWDSQIPMVVGMACLLGGLYTATKWR